MSMFCIRGITSEVFRPSLPWKPIWNLHYQYWISQLLSKQLQLVLIELVLIGPLLGVLHLWTYLRVITFFSSANFLPNFSLPNLIFLFFFFQPLPNLFFYSFILFYNFTFQFRHWIYNDRLWQHIRDKVGCSFVLQLLYIRDGN